MKDFLTRVSKGRFPYSPLVTVEISRANLLHNLHEFQKIAPEHAIAPVLKSNAYGHGLVEVGKILEQSQNRFTKEYTFPIPFLVVDSYFEAITLRTRGIHIPILVIGYTPPETIARARLKKTSFTVTSLEALRNLAELELPPWKSYTEMGIINWGIALFPRKQHIHLKIDTGMHRQGILPEEIEEAIAIIKSEPSLVLEGICSHLSDADNDDQSFTEGQIITWNKAVKTFRAAFPHIKYWHLSNTDGHRFDGEINANVSRLGIGLYGLCDGKLIHANMDLAPVLEMRTLLTGIKHLKTGETVGYGNTYKAEKDKTIATIPVGYYEGVDRRLSNCGTVLVGEKHIPCPIIGRVSMNITVIDVSAVPDARMETEVTVVSRNANETNSVFNISKTIGTIVYEDVVKIPTHLKRVVV